MNPTPREVLLIDATVIVTKDRAKAYGEPEDCFKIIAGFWNIYLVNGKGLGTINPQDVAIMMALMKIARLTINPAHRDSLVDLAGYAACAAECQELSRGHA